MKMTSNYGTPTAVPSSPRDPVPTSPAIATSPSVQQAYGLLPQNLQMQIQHQQQLTSQGYHSTSNNTYQNTRYSGQNVFQFDHLYTDDEKKSTPIPLVQIKVDNHSPSVNMNFNFPQSTGIKTENLAPPTMGSGINDDKPPTGMSPLNIAVTYQEGSQTSPASSNQSLSSHGLRYQRSTGSGDAMLSAINYNDNDVLQDSGFDVTGNIGNLEDGILSSMNANGSIRLPENHPGSTFDLFDGDGNVNEAYIEQSQDLHLPSNTYTDSGAGYSITDGSKVNEERNRRVERQSSPSVTSIQQQHDKPVVPISQPTTAAPTQQRQKGRPGRSGRTPGSRPNLTCPTCGKTFNNSSAIAKHKLTHSDERKYVCSLCSKAFKRQDHLNGHMLTHRDKKPYECKFEGCDKSYSDARSLRRHLENHHQNVDPLNAYNPANSRMYSGYNYNSSNQPQYFQFEKPQYNANGNQGEQWQGVRYRSGDHSPGYLQQVSPISPAPGHPTSPMHTNAPRMPWLGPGSIFDDSLKPVECTMCHRRFKNIPALNGHMRLHGGYFKKQDVPVKKLEANEKEKSQPTTNQNQSSGQTFQQPQNLPNKSLPPPPPLPPPAPITTVQTSITPQPLPSISHLQAEYIKQQKQQQAIQQQEIQEQQAVAALQQLQQQAIHHQQQQHQKNQQQQQQQQQTSVRHQQQQQLLSSQLPGGSNDMSVATLLQQHLRLPSVSTSFMLPPQTQSNLPPHSDASLDLNQSMLPLTTDAGILGVQLSQHDLKQVVSSVSDSILPTPSVNLATSFQTLLQNTSESLSSLTGCHTGNDLLVGNSQNTTMNVTSADDITNNDSLFTNPDISTFATTEGTRLTDDLTESLETNTNSEPVLIRDSMLSAASNAPLCYADQQNNDNNLNPQNIAVQLMIKSPTTGQTFSFPDRAPHQFTLPKSINVDLDSRNNRALLKNAIFERKRHLSADPDKFTMPKRVANTQSSLAVLLNSHYSKKTDTSINKPQGAPRTNNMKQRQSSGDKDDGVFQRPSDDALPRSRPRSRADDPLSRSYPGPMEDSGLFRNPSGLTSSPAKGRKKHRPEPLFIPPHVNHFGFQSRLRSPRLWDSYEMRGARGNTPPPYTPPPMLSPVRKGSGLFWTIQSYRPITPKSAPITPKTRVPTSIIPSEPPLIEEPEEESPPETDIRPHVNIGAQYQAELPQFSEIVDYKETDISKEDLLWEPGSYGDNSDEEVQFYLDFACCAAVPGNGTNKEYAIHLLHLAKGQIQDALIMLMQGQPMVPKDHTLCTYKYQETGMWTTEEIDLYHQALLKCDKDFFQIANEVMTKSTRECVEFYYLWKKVCPDEYKRLRIIRRKREQEEIYNLRSKAAQDKQSEDENSKDSNLFTEACDNNSASNGPFACLYTECTATFPSKQALNGHIRIHYIKTVDTTDDSNKLPVARNNNIESSPSRSYTSDEPDEYPCRICGKVFSKVKSRSAHMKSHRPTDADSKPKAKG